MFSINFQVCFFRQFFRSVRRADYLTMRHGFVTVSSFDNATSVICLRCLSFSLTNVNAPFTFVGSFSTGK